MALKKKKSISVSTQDAIAELFGKLHDVGCDPIRQLAELAVDPTIPLSDRISILKDLAQYTAPKRRAVDVTASNDAGVVVKIIKYSKDTVGQVQKMMKPEMVKRELEKNAEELEEIKQETVANG